MHCAPAYGVDDFNSCVSQRPGVQRHPQPRARQWRQYAADFPLFGGQHIWKAVPRDPRALQSGRAACWAPAGITHSYPHCWRHKTPVIYRAAAQWFVRMDEGEGVFTDPAQKPAQTLRQIALAAIENTSFYPKTARPACAT